MFRKGVPGNPKEALHDDQFEYSQPYLSRERRMLFLRGVIAASPVRNDSNGPSWIGDDIMALNHEDQTKPIYVMIDSPGGDVTTGLTLYDIMKYSRAPIYTICAAGASMATIVMQAATERLCLPHSRFMLHLPSGGFSGDADEIKTRSELLTSLKDELIDIYIDHGVTAGLVGKTSKEIRKKILIDINKEKWLTTEQALTYGLVDRIATQDEMMGTTLT